MPDIPMAKMCRAAMSNFCCLFRTGCGAPPTSSCYHGGAGLRSKTSSPLVFPLTRLRISHP